MDLDAGLYELRASLNFNLEILKVLKKVGERFEINLQIWISLARVILSTIDLAVCPVLDVVTSRLSKLATCCRCQS